MAELFAFKESASEYSLNWAPRRVGYSVSHQTGLRAEMNDAIKKLHDLAAEFEQ